MSKIGTLTQFTAATTIVSDEVDANFDEIKTKVNTFGVWTDAVATITSVHTFSAAPVFSAGFTVAGTLTLTTAASKIVPGATSFSVRDTGDTVDNLLVTEAGAVTVLNGLTVSGGGAAITGALTATTYNGITVSAAGGDTTLTGNLVVLGQVGAARKNAGNSGATLTLDFDDGNVQRVNMTASCVFTFSNPAAGSMYVVEVLQAGAGSFLVTWPTTVKWDSGVTPTLSTAAGKKDVFTFLFNGTNYLGGTFGIAFADTI